MPQRQIGARPSITTSAPRGMSGSHGIGSSGAIPYWPKARIYTCVALALLIIQEIGWQLCQHHRAFQIAGGNGGLYATPQEIHDERHVHAIIPSGNRTKAVGE